MSEIKPLPLKVFVLDDSPADLELIKIALQLAKTPYSLQFFLNGNDLLDSLRAADLPDLLLLDVNMPGIDGLEILKMMSTHKDWSRIHVALLISADEEISLLEKRGASPESYLKKPADFSSFNRVANDFDLLCTKI